MFYKIPKDSIIRQGDVTEGIISLGAVANKLLRRDNICGFDSEPNFSIDLRFNYNVVMTPCCNIKKAKYISFCPLYQVSKKIKFDNKYLEEDPTKINEPVTAEQSMPKRRWEKLGEEEKERKRQQGKNFSYLDHFAFKKYEGIFEEDMIIDFNDIFCIRRKDLGNNFEEMVPFKVLQLTDDTRAKFRQKLIKYFGRDPEDECELGT